MLFFQYSVQLSTTRNLYMWQPCVSEKFNRLLIFQTFLISLTQSTQLLVEQSVSTFDFKKWYFFLLLLLLINESFTMCVGRESFCKSLDFPVHSSIYPRNGSCGYSVLSFQTHKEPSIWGNSGGEYFHADSETSRVTPVWRCHAWLWKGKNNASLEKGEKSLVQSQF